MLYALLIGCEQRAPDSEERASESDTSAPPDTGTPIDIEFPRAIDACGGSLHTCALTEVGEVVCWGESVDEFSDVPSGVMFSQIGCGAYHMCGLDEVGAIHCWGLDDWGHELVQPPSGEFVSLQVGNSTDCAISAAGEVICWPEFAEDRVPQGTFVSEFSNGLNADCAITLEDGLDCWCEALDESQADTAACRRLIAYPTGEFVNVSMGDYHACVLDMEGAATCWGGFWSGTDNLGGVSISLLWRRAGMPMTPTFSRVRAGPGCRSRFSGFEARLSVCNSIKMDSPLAQ